MSFDRRGNAWRQANQLQSRNKYQRRLRTERGSDVKGLEICDALHSQVPVLLHEVVLEAAGLRCLENLWPIETIFAHSYPTAPGTTARTRTLPSLLRHRRVQIHALKMHRLEPSGILVEVHDRVADDSHRGHLELHLHKVGIE